MDILPLPLAHHPHRAVLVADDDGLVPAVALLPLQHVGEAASGQRPLDRVFDAHVIEDRRQEVVVAQQIFVDDAGGKTPGTTRDEGHLHRLLEHVERVSAVALPVDAVMSQVVAVVAGEEHERVVGDTQCVESVEQTPDARVHRRNRREVALYHLAALLGRRIPASPRMGRQYRQRAELALVVKLPDLRWLLALPPRRVRRGVVHAQAERLLAVPPLIQTVDGAVGKQVGDIMRLPGQLGVVVEDEVIGVAVAAQRVCAPVRVALLRCPARPQMPLARQPAAIPIRRQHVSEACQPLQILDGPVPAAPRHPVLDIDIARLDPVVDAVL